MKIPPLAPQALPAPDVPYVTGHWFEIKYVPDIGIEEWRNIGVAFVDAGGNIHSKLLDDLSVLRHIHGGHSAEMIRFLLCLLEEALQAEEVYPPSPHLFFGPCRFAQGESILAILEDAFASNVTLAPPKSTRPRQNVARSTETVRKQVLAALRKIGGARAESIIARRPATVTDAAGQMHALDLPIFGKGVYGNIISGCYRSADVTEVQLLRAALELETAARIRQGARRGLFILEPGNVVRVGLADVWRSSGNRIERIEWQLHNLEVHVGMASHPDRLAERILVWAESG